MLLLKGFVHLSVKTIYMNPTKISIPLSLIFFFLLITSSIFGQSYQKISIGFYNLENLFDTIDSPDINDIEFTPNEPKKWDTRKYFEKLDNMASAIAKIAVDKTPEGMAVIGLCEMENKEVLIDLANHPLLKKRNYKIVHYNSPDKRGIDVALLYQDALFELESSYNFPLTINNVSDFYSRDQLLVTGKLLGERVYFIVNHWPSRSGGENETADLRKAAGDLGRKISDFIIGMDPNAKIMYMGDFNDDPHNVSITEHLKASGDKQLATNGYFNPYASLHKPDNFGSLAYRGKWNLFDQIVVTPSLLTKKPKKWYLEQPFVFDAEFLKNKDGNYMGFPFRTFAGNTFLGGFSDHLPVYIVLQRSN